jgi:hypothetical protein
VEKTITARNPECAKALEQAFGDLHKKLEIPEGREEIVQKLR